MAKGSLTSLQYSDIKRIYARRCNRKACMRLVQPHSFHPIFVQRRNGNSITSFAIQAASLFCAIIGFTTVQTHLMLDVKKRKFPPSTATSKPREPGMFS